MNRRLKHFAAPQFGIVNRELNHQPARPENCQTAADPTSGKSRFGQSARAKQSHGAHHGANQADEKVVDSENLLIETRHVRAFFMPVQESIEKRVRDAENNQHKTGEFEVQREIEKRHDF